MLNEFLFKRISSSLIPKSSKLHRCVKKLGLRAIDVGVAGDCFLIDLYHINDNYVNNNHYMQVRIRVEFNI